MRSKQKAQNMVKSRQALSGSIVAMSLFIRERKMLIEQTVKDYLDSVLNNTGIKVYPEIPKNPPEKFVVFKLIDRGRENMINEVTFEFYSYGNNTLEAAEVDESLRNAMDNIVTINDISCHYGGGNNSPDTTLKRYRYRSYYNLYY